MNRNGTLLIIHRFGSTATICKAPAEVVAAAAAAAEEEQQQHQQKKHTAAMTTAPKASSP